MRAAAVLALALGLVPAAFATHPGWGSTTRMNLDGDSTRERLFARSDTHPDRATIYVIDRCRGADMRHELALPGIKIFRWSVRGTRDLGRPGVLFIMRYLDGHAIARVARLRIQRPGECPTPVSLFDYSTDSPPRPPPEGLVLLDFYVRVHDYSNRFSGPELRLEELYGTTPSGTTTATRFSYFRYSVRTREYALYRTAVTRA